MWTWFTRCYRIKPEKVMGARLLLVSPADRAWSQGLANALVLELAPNQTHDWLFSHKANSQIRWLTITLLSIVGPRVRRMHFFSPPQVSLPLHAEFTPSNNVSHYFLAWYIRLSPVCKDCDRALMLDIYQISLFSSHCNVNAWQRVSYSPFCFCYIYMHSENASHSELPFHMTWPFPFHTPLHYTID